MPFSKSREGHEAEYWTRHFESFLKPLIEENTRLVAQRSQPLRGDILREIIKQLVTSPVVVADITDGKPNVLWELGVRQSFKHGTITVAEDGTPIPFDLGPKGTLFYSYERFKQTEFSQRFKKALQDCLEHPERTDSHVLEALSGRGSLFEIFRKEGSIRRLDGMQSEVKRNLDLIARIQIRSSRNQKKPRGRWMYSSRLRLPALELLITNRYVEEREAFFKAAERCYDWALRLNEKLGTWEQSPEAKDKWILARGPKAAKSFQNFREMLGGAQLKIRKLV